MPVVLLDNIVLEWSREGVPAVNDVLAHYTIACVPPQPAAQEATVKATRLSLWEQNSEIREVFTLWLEALEARGIAPRTLESQQYIKD
jgi:hypothetical protein